MNITRISIERPTIAVVVFTLLIILGIFSYHFLTYELVPKFNPPVLTITTVYPGASPDEVENNVSIIIEDAVSSLENIDVMTSTSIENFSLVKLDMKPGTDVKESLQEAERKLNTILNNLPAEARKPVLSRFDFDDLPVIRMGAYSNMAPHEFTSLVKEQILPVLNQIEGVAEVRLLGGVEKEVNIQVEAIKLQLYNVSLMQILRAINTANINIPAGKVVSDEDQQSVRLIGRFQSLKDIEELIIAEIPQINKKVRLKDVAKIEFTDKEAVIITRINGVEAIGIDIRKQSDANAVEMSAKVNAALRVIESKYEKFNIRFEIAQDTSLFTIAAADAVMVDLLWAIVLVSLVMIIFLHSFRNSLIVLISIPSSIISTFIVMYLLGYSLNLLTLLGLSLAIGILVDDSIVVLENIYRHIEMGKNKVLAAYQGRTEIGFTAISITLIDVVVFLPIILSKGLVADMLREYSVVIVSSTLFSLFVSFTLVPLLSSRFSKLERVKGKTLMGKAILSFESFIETITDGLANMLKMAFRHKFLTLFIAVILLIGASSLIYFGFIGLEFTKAGDRSEFILELELEKDATLQRSNQVARLVEDYLSSKKEVTNIFTTVGITSSGKTEFNTAYLSEINVQLVNKKDRDISTTLFARKLKNEIESRIPGLTVRPVDINLIGLRDDDAVQVTLVGSNPDSLSRFSNTVFEQFKNISGTVEVQTTLSPGNREISVIPDRDKMQLLGINIAQAGMVLRTAFNGNTDAKFYSAGTKHDINIHLRSFDRKNIGDIKNLSVLNQRGDVIRFDQFSDIVESKSASKLERTNRSASVTIKSQVIGRPAGTIGNELNRQISKLDKPEGIEFFFGGQTKRTMDGLKSMMFALFIAVLLVYMILVALYDSYVYPFVVLFSIPLAAIGALLALALSMESLSIFSILGMIMLVGLVGKNAILVVDFTNKLKENGMEWQEALITATKLRFRPILMTNITMIIGLMPIAFATGAGSEWKNGLAWALIGGLTSSMVLTMIVVPVVYYLVERFLEKTGLVNQKKIRVPEL